MYDADTEHELVARAKEMAGSRKCATCYAAEVDQEKYRKGSGDLRGRHWTFELRHHQYG